MINVSICLVLPGIHSCQVACILLDTQAFYIYLKPSTSNCKVSSILVCIELNNETKSEGYGPLRKPWPIRNAPISSLFQPLLICYILHFSRVSSFTILQCHCTVLPCSSALYFLKLGNYGYMLPKIKLLIVNSYKILNYTCDYLILGLVFAGYA